MSNKLTPRLQARLAQGPRDQLVEVVVRFNAPARDRAPVPAESRSAEIERRQREFADQLDRVNRALGLAVCDAERAAWINRTCRAVLDGATIARLASCADVQSVDLPASIARE